MLSNISVSVTDAVLATALQDRHCFVSEYGWRSRRTLLSLCLVNRKTASVATPILYETVCPRYTYKRKEARPPQRDKSESRSRDGPDWFSNLRYVAEGRPSQLLSTRVLILDPSALSSTFLYRALPLFRNIRALLIDHGSLPMEAHKALSTTVPKLEQLEHMRLVCGGISSSLATSLAGSRLLKSLSLDYGRGIGPGPSRPLRVQRLHLYRFRRARDIANLLEDIQREFTEELSLDFSAADERGYILQEISRLGWPALRTLTIRRSNGFQFPSPTFFFEGAMPALKELRIPGLTTSHHRNDQTYETVLATMPPTVTTLDLSATALYERALQDLKNQLDANAPYLRQVRLIKFGKYFLSLPYGTRRSEVAGLQDAARQLEAIASVKGVSLQPKLLGDAVKEAIARYTFPQDPIDNEDNG